jgi:uncharacterized membrane protein
MLDKIITAVEPFALTIIVLAGATLTGWVTFSNKYVVGVATVFCGTLLILSHIARRVKSN